MINIKTFQQGISYMEKGNCILYDWRNFLVGKELRDEIEYLLFRYNGTNKLTLEEAKSKYNKYCWNLYEVKQCSECFKPITEFANEHIVKILSDNVHHEYALDPRNQILLCKKCKSKWRSSKKLEMSIYPTNQLIKKIIKGKTF